MGSGRFEFMQGTTNAYGVVYLRICARPAGRGPPENRETAVGTKAVFRQLGISFPNSIKCVIKAPGVSGTFSISLSITTASAGASAFPVFTFK